MKSPWYPRYTQDVTGSIDCRTMTLEEFGLYNWLLDYSWNNEAKPCHLIYDPEELARLVGVPLRKFVHLWVRIEKKFKRYIDPDTQEEYIYNVRLLHEYTKRVAQSERQEGRARHAAEKRWKQHAPSNAPSNAPGMLQASAKQCLTDSPLQSQSEDPPKVPLTGDGVRYPPEFEEFWKIYPRHDGKGAALKAWKKIRPSLALQEIIRRAVEQQRQSVQWKKDNGQFIPHASTWLNESRWDDDTPKAKAATAVNIADRWKEFT